MEVVINNIGLLCEFVRRAVLTDSCELNFVINEAALEESSVVDQIILRPFIESGKVRVESMTGISYVEIYSYKTRYGLKRYSYYEFYSIEIAKKRGLRLVTDNSAMKQLAQLENVKILTTKQVEDISIRKIKYEDVIKIKKPDNL